MPFATVNGLRLYYELHGDGGEPLVFVHGFTGDGTDRQNQIGEFAGDSRVLVFDKLVSATRRGSLRARGGSRS